MRADDVSAQQKAIEGRQDAPLFQCGGESAGGLGAGGAAAGFVLSPQLGKEH